MVLDRGRACGRRLDEKERAEVALYTSDALIAVIRIRMPPDGDPMLEYFADGELREV